MMNICIFNITVKFLHQASSYRVTWNTVGVDNRPYRQPGNLTLSAYCCWQWHKKHKYHSAAWSRYMWLVSK